jgi:ketosteroid isomerase-like protein
MTDSSAGGDESEPSGDETPAAGREPDQERASVSPGDVAAEVDEEYDFEEFGPRQMAEMTAEEWEAAFDPDTWITGRELLDRVEADLRHRVATRDVFAVVERDSIDGEPVVLAYSDEGYGVVYADGTVEGTGTVLRDVKPTVALCSMDDYDVPDAPEEAGLPDPREIPEGSSGFGTSLLKYVGLAQLAAGVLLFLAPFVYDPVVRGCPPIQDSAARACSVGGTTLTLHPLGDSAVIAAIAGVGFVAFGVFMLTLVANARLSDRFRAEEFRNRLRSAGVGGDDRPAFVPETDGHERDDEQGEEAP